MDKLKAMANFVRIVDSGSLSAAADVTGQSVASVVRCDRARTSSATTAKPRPYSPARAASMAALRASRLVCSAMVTIMSST